MWWFACPELSGMKSWFELMSQSTSGHTRESKDKFLTLSFDLHNHNYMYCVGHYCLQPTGVCIHQYQSHFHKCHSYLGYAFLHCWLYPFASSCWKCMVILLVLKLFEFVANQHTEYFFKRSSLNKFNPPFDWTLPLIAASIVQNSSKGLNLITEFFINLWRKKVCSLSSNLSSVL